jgi:NAD(P)-dependent dehydrogenase (short-subunit alcohol dehydrogenase family)
VPQVLAGELAEHWITVNAIVAGLFPSKMTAGLFKLAGMAYCHFQSYLLSNSSLKK